MRRSYTPTFFVVGCWLAIVASIVLTNASKPQAQRQGVPIIIDGDTLAESSRSPHVRLSGIDAPEHDQTCITKDIGKSVPCGVYATEALRTLVGSGNLKCITEATDAYGRNLATCYVESINVNQRMVRLGWALAYTRYTDRYLSDQRAAQSEGLGIWGTTFETPESYRHKSHAKRAD